MEYFLITTEYFELGVGVHLFCLLFTNVRQPHQSRFHSFLLSTISLTKIVLNGCLTVPWVVCWHFLPYSSALTDAQILSELLTKSLKTRRAGNSPQVPTCWVWHQALEVNKRLWVTKDNLKANLEARDGDKNGIVFSI